MIHFEILKSPDDEIIESYTFKSNQVYLGKTKGDLFIKDPKLKESHILMEVLDHKLILHPQRGVDFYLINGKRATSIRSISKGQKVTIGETEILLINFSLSAVPSKKEILEKNLDELVKNNSPKLEIIEELSRMMK